MLAAGIKEHSFKGPKPVASGGGSLSKPTHRYTALGGLFKSDSSTSLHDITIPKPTKKKKHRPRSREKTIIPLLGRDGSTAALCPEEATPTHVTGTGTGSKETHAPKLRFPLLSPSRRETFMFFRMKTMQKTAQLANALSLPENLHHVGQPETPHGETLQPTNHVTNSSRGHTRGRASVEFEKVPASRERLMNLEKQYSRKKFHGTKKSGRKEKIIVSSKYGYSSRSNSATYKRLNKSRSKMDDQLEAQVVKATENDKAKIPIYEDKEELNKPKPKPVMNSSKGIPIKDKMPQLPFNLDASIYSSFKEKKDLGILYQSTSGESRLSKRSSAKSLTIFLPKIEKELTNIDSLPTDRSGRTLHPTPRDQNIDKSRDVNTNHETLQEEDLVVPLSLDSITQEEFQNLDINAPRDKLPDVRHRKSISFDASIPNTPQKKRPLRSRRSRRTQSKASSHIDEEPQYSFLIDDSKSITPSPNKAKRRSKNKNQPSAEAIEAYVRSRATSKASKRSDNKIQDSQSEAEMKPEVNTRPETDENGDAQAQDSYVSNGNKIHETEEIERGTSIDLVRECEEVIGKERETNIKHFDDDKPTKYTPITFSDSEDGFVDDFENI